MLQNSKRYWLLETSVGCTRHTLCALLHGAHTSAHDTECHVSIYMYLEGAIFKQHHGINMRHQHTARAPYVLDQYFSLHDLYYHQRCTAPAHDTLAQQCQQSLSTQHRPLLIPSIGAPTYTAEQGISSSHKNCWVAPASCADVAAIKAACTVDQILPNLSLTQRVCACAADTAATPDCMAPKRSN